ncbi:MAG: hypothetical protein F6J89_09255 [Symploca sp. SIO1C4]|uniref:Uncharacterized protein n=1 Tax=Symploca sp. SIO1C4 TaxID=2607765 RepID=A0A6B3NCM2_9CYAN|nr:hypothetical protein [Symploca sp. SIO1C4]
MNKVDLLSWNGFDLDYPLASYAYGDGRDEVWVERDMGCTSSQTFRDAKQLIYCRTFEGWEGNERDYCEIYQEYSHLTHIHFRPEYSAYCRFDDHGDIDNVVTITLGEDKNHPNVSLVSFKREPLEEYLVATKSSLVRLFDFTLYRKNCFSGWPGGDETQGDLGDNCFYRQRVLEGYAAYTHGVELVPLSRSKDTITSILKGGGRVRNTSFAQFIIWDWRNGQNAIVSTNPDDTTNYFEAKNNSLPYELSPAFFRPEVLSKYKMNKEKYTVGEHEVTCRAAWYLRGIDINEAGQVHAYICDLRHLPFQEQQYWASYNEKPKASISERAIIHDFKGEYGNIISPLQSILSIMRRWRDENVEWWNLRENSLFDNVSIPVTTSKDEWSEAFMDLSKLIIEGFNMRFLRKQLDEMGINYKKEEQSILLLEKVRMAHAGNEAPIKLDALRTVQQIRSKVKGHSGSTEAQEIVTRAISEHGSFSQHFKETCRMVAKELGEIEQVFNP